MTRESWAQRKKKKSGDRAPARASGPQSKAWNRETENLYSAWIETLFDAPLEEAPSWKAMHEVLRDPSRNLLFNHLGLREDQKGLVIQPDCADVPYFLRAYFAFKMGLPFGYSNARAATEASRRNAHNGGTSSTRNRRRLCRRPVEGRRASSACSAAADAAPRCSSSPQAEGLVPGFRYYLSTTVANAVHSGNGRTAAEDNDTDYYQCR